MPQLPKLSRCLGLLVAALIATLTLAITARAVEVLSIPDAAFINYTLAAGANSAPITVPLTDAGPGSGVLVMGVCNTLGFRGVGFVTLLRVPSSFLEWVGLESTAGASITQGFSGAPGTHIVFIDFAHQVDIEVNNANSIRVHNGAGALRAGNVKLIW
jgi:hypothetical protein